ncbi:MAG: Tad domain-containing protein [Candidatus Eisenbacteria bacterium]|nr:Tad domain-containing protein [Candidatus Eisenbacteria bacterium]
MPLIAFLIVVMLGLAAFAVDIGYILVTKQQLQNAADACVLAGAGALILMDEPTKTAEVEARVVDMASRHKAGDDESVYIVPAEDIIMDGYKLTVHTRKLKSRGNGLPLFFAKILRMPLADVEAKAAVLLTPTSSACCVKPWSVPDKWDDDTTIPGHEDWRNNNVWNGEEFEDSNDNRLYDPGEMFTDENGNGVYDSEVYDRALSQANEAGYIPSLPPDGHIGEQVMLKIGSEGDRLAPSFFNPIVLPWPEEYEDEGGTGADAYRDAIAKCNPMVIEQNQTVEVSSEPGRMVGPTVQGTKIVMEGDPTAFWNEEIDNVDHTEGGNIGVSTRIVLVPVFDPRMWPMPGRMTEQKGNAIVITKIVAFFLEDLDKDVITARVTKAPVSCIKGTQPGGGESFTWTYQMVE